MGITNYKIIALACDILFFRWGRIDRSGLIARVTLDNMLSKQGKI